MYPSDVTYITFESKASTRKVIIILPLPKKLGKSCHHYLEVPNPKDSLLSWILEPNPMTCVPLDIMLRCACALRAVEEQDMEKARGLLLGGKMATSHDLGPKR